MAGKRILGVTEARLGLSVLTAVLLVIGYVVLQHLGDPHESPPVEIRTNLPTSPLNGTVKTSKPDDLHVLQAQNPDSAHVPRTSSRPSFTTTPKFDLPGELDRTDGDLMWPVPPIGDEGFGQPTGPRR